MNDKICGKENMLQRRQKRNKQRTAERKCFWVGIAMLGCLLTCAGQVAGTNDPPPPPVDAENPQKEIGLVAAMPQALEMKEEFSSADDWCLLLVNPWNPLPSNFTVSLTPLKNGQSIDARCFPDLQAMMDDCRAAGLNPLICSSYRSQEKQEQLFTKQVNSYIAQGYSAQDARMEAGKLVAIPGTSEHQLGLAVDLVDLSNQNLDESQENTAVQKWLMKNSWQYGFILRYPNGKSHLTGIIYEPWHYRYVGKAAAKEIYTQQICLEEFEGL